MTDATRSPNTPNLEKLVETRLIQYREVPDLLEWHLPLGAALLQLAAEDRPLTAEEVASVLGWPVEEVQPRFEEVVESVRVVFDRERGMSLAESTSEGVPLPVYRVRWLDSGKVAKLPGCAGDALSAVLSTGWRARIELRCPTTGRLVSVQVGRAGEFEGVEPGRGRRNARGPRVRLSPARLDSQ